MVNSRYKFRAWDEINNKWHDGYDLIMESSGFVWAGDINNTPMVQIKKENVVFFTGLKDKNGKEIYEGDILKDDTKQIKTVIFQNGTFGCYANRRISFYTDETIDIFYSLLEYVLSDVEIEIIGNIYENAEII